MTSSESAVFRLPECWNDDVRMAALFATPRNEATNPHDWAGKYKFWKDLVLDFAKSTGKLTISLDDVNEAFCRKGKYPACLARVLEEMNNKGEISLKDRYVNQSNTTSWTSWGIGLVKTSVAWSWNKVLGSLTEIEKGVTSYIVPAVLEDKCAQVLQLPEASMEEVVDLEELTDLYPELFPDDDETHIILSHLQRMGKIAVDSSSAQTMVKFLASATPKKQSSKASQSILNSSTSVAWSNTPPVRTKEKPSAEITEVDRSLAALKRTEKLLDSEIKELEEQMNTLRMTAKAKLNEGSREAAKAALARRKQLQAFVDKRNQALDNIQTMKIQLTQAKTDSKVMDAYKMGLAALKKTFADPMLNEDKVQDTMSELEELMEQHRDIGTALSQSIVAPGETESDLEDELADILASEAAKEKPEEEPELQLPSVPAESPSREPQPSRNVEPLPQSRVFSQ